LKISNVGSAIQEIPWFHMFIFIIFLVKGRGKINLWNQGIQETTVVQMYNNNCSVQTQIKAA
jgi:hypothetical protein